MSKLTESDKGKSIESIKKFYQSLEDYEYERNFIVRAYILDKNDEEIEEFDELGITIMNDSNFWKIGVVWPDPIFIKYQSIGLKGEYWNSTCRIYHEAGRLRIKHYQSDLTVILSKK
jgi:hypothetical protein